MISILLVTYKFGAIQLWSQLCAISQYVTITCTSHSVGPPLSRAQTPFWARDCHAWSGQWDYNENWSSVIGLKVDNSSEYKVESRSVQVEVQIMNFVTMSGVKTHGNSPCPLCNCACAISTHNGWTRQCTTDRKKLLWMHTMFSLFSFKLKIYQI